MKPTIATTRNLIRSFGRVNGRKLRVGQTNLIENLLPKYAIRVQGKEGSEIESSDLQDIFGKTESVLPNPQSLNPNPYNLNPETYLEIGFGYGEHLAGMAMQYPDVNFIGCEPFVNGVATLLKHIDDNKIENIRILHGDARLLVEKLPEASIDRLFILFPDPWPKSKHHKKRIISGESLKDFARIMKPGARLDIATDHVAYGEWIAEHLGNSADFKPNDAIGIAAQPDDWIPTRYQKKAEVQGRGARFFNYMKI